MAYIYSFFAQNRWIGLINQFFSFGAYLFSLAENQAERRLEGEDNLITKAQKGDEQAFSELYNFYFPKIYSFIIKRCGHQETAEDITSQVFLKAFAKLPKYVSQGHPFGSWVYRIATNALTDHFRKASTRREKAVDVLPEIIEDHNSSHDQVISLESKEEVLSLVGKLAIKDQKIIQLKFFAELSINEISAMLEITPNVVAVRVHRAVKRLQKISNNS